MKRKILSSIIAMLILFSSITPVIGVTFTDVPSTHKHKDAIDFCSASEFIVGKGNGKFDPDGTMTRVEFITVWAKTFHARRHDFNDATKTKDDMDNAIVLMQGLGYISGVSENSFHRSGKITREQVAQIAYNTYLKGVSSDDEYENYSDHSSVSSWARHAVSVCYKKGTFDSIVEANKFKPGQFITRAEVCAVLTKLLKTEVEPQLYNITIADIAHGSVTADKTKASEGETVTLTVTADSGYEFVAGSLKYNDAAVTGNSFEMPADDVEITAEFNLAEAPAAKHTITISAMTNGAVTADKTEAAAGETVTLTVNPDANYELVAGSLKYNNTAITGTSFEMPAENVVISAEFELTEVPAVKHTITISAMTNGAVTSDKTEAAAGETVTLTVTPDTNYGLVTGSLKYNNVEITGTSFAMPAENVAITATFEAT